MEIGAGDRVVFVILDLRVTGVLRDNSGTLHVVREKNGRPVVTDSGRKGIWAAQAVDGKGDVYFGTQGKRIYGFGPHGAKLFEITASGPIDSYPALTADGDLIIGDEAGTLYAIG